MFRQDKLRGHDQNEAHRKAYKAWCKTHSYNEGLDMDMDNDDASEGPMAKKARTNELLENNFRTVIDRCL